jgi:hypothetical protein
VCHKERKKTESYFIRRKDDTLDLHIGNSLSEQVLKSFRKLSKGVIRSLETMNEDDEQDIS